MKIEEIVGFKSNPDNIKKLDVILSTLCSYLFSTYSRKYNTMLRCNVSLKMS